MRQLIAIAIVLIVIVGLAVALGLSFDLSASPDPRLGRDSNGHTGERLAEGGHTAETNAAFDDPKPRDRRAHLGLGSVHTHLEVCARYTVTFRAPNCSSRSAESKESYSVR